jgi:hypothetical protein
VFIRRKTNKSGKISIQIIDTSGYKDRLIKTIGCSSDPGQIKQFLIHAREWIAGYTRQHRLYLEFEEDKTFMKGLKEGLSKIQMIGPELILGKLFSQPLING